MTSIKTDKAVQWQAPLKYAAALEGRDFVLLYSGMEPGGYSFLAWELKESITSIHEFQIIQNESKWFGWLGYGLRHLSEKLPKDSGSVIELPEFLMMRFANIAIFDHAERTITGKLPEPAELPPYRKPQVTFESVMSDGEFKDKVAHIVRKINDGELYQANLTRKFYGDIAGADSFSLFCRLAEISPAPYSAYIQYQGAAIISASPEMFLKVENGLATTMPIKGTLSTARPASELYESEKDRAENLMIVDLMRNDLSKNCRNVKVEKLFEITSYAKYHHMSSTITGLTNTAPLDVALGCFPPGSMTGAPKIHAMKMISELEEVERGLYSGAIGYFEKDRCDLSVVIRTLIIKDGKFEFQVGCGIVADSVPEKELEESYVKASGILEVLGLKH